MICSQNWVPTPGSKINYLVPNPGNKYQFFAMTGQNTVNWPVFSFIYPFWTIFCSIFDFASLHSVHRSISDIIHCAQCAVVHTLHTAVQNSEH